MSAKRVRVLRALALVAIGAVFGGALTIAVMFRWDRGPATNSTPGAVDVGFSQDMIVHHEQAVTMAQMVDDQGSPELRSLANGIEITQLGEIGTMQGWLTLWKAPPASVGAPMQWMASAHSGKSGMSMPTASAMPGMASQEELQRLERATGKAKEILFLQLMTRHHQGGLAMAAYANAHASLPAVRALAARMALDEGQEINLMAQLLRIDHAKPLSPP